MCVSLAIAVLNRQLWLEFETVITDEAWKGCLINLQGVGCDVTVRP